MFHDITVGEPEIVLVEDILRKEEKILTHMKEILDSSFGSSSSTNYSKKKDLPI